MDAIIKVGKGAVISGVITLVTGIFMGPFGLAIGGVAGGAVVIAMAFVKQSGKAAVSGIVSVTGGLLFGPVGLTVGIVLCGVVVLVMLYADVRLPGIRTDKSNRKIRR